VSVPGDPEANPAAGQVRGRVEGGVLRERDAAEDG
jgi:hypothetical protein